MTDVGRARILAVVLVVVAAAWATGCRPAERPSRDAWQVRWEATQGIVPAADELERPPRAETCQDVLGELRARRPDLSPAPDQIIAEAVEGWFEHAEGMFFDCFEGSDPEAAVAGAYEQLERLRSEVDAALDEGG